MFLRGFVFGAPTRTQAMSLAMLAVATIAANTAPSGPAYAQVICPFYCGEAPLTRIVSAHGYCSDTPAKDLRVQCRYWAQAEGFLWADCTCLPSAEIIYPEEEEDGVDSPNDRN